MTASLDVFDRRLLNLVQRDASMTADQIAEHLALSPSSIQRRLKRLRSSGHITAEVAVVDPRKVGKPTFFVVSLEVEREHPDLLGRLRAWLKEQDEVQQVFYVTGSADFVVVLTAQDVSRYDELMAKLVSENPNVRRFTTNVVLGIVKRGLMVPVPESWDRFDDS